MKIDAIEQRELLIAINLIRAFIENLEPQKNCASCEYWQGGGGNGGCTLASMAVPPQHIIENGCDKWEVFTIPF